MSDKVGRELARSLFSCSKSRAYNSRGKSRCCTAVVVVGEWREQGWRFVDRKFCIRGWLLRKEGVVVLGTLEKNGWWSFEGEV